MNYYLDFEATNSGQIISIGCVTEDNNTFYTLVKPNNENVSFYISQLTDITNEMLAKAPTADQAFQDFYKFIIATEILSDSEINNFYVYGDMDKTFLDTTIQNMNDIISISCANALNLIDLQPTVKSKFGKLYRLIDLYNCVIEEKTEQTHNALDDAIKLKMVHENLNTIVLNKKFFSSNLDREICLNNTLNFKLESITYNIQKAPEIWFTWSDKYNKRFEANTLADKDNYFIKYYNSKLKKVKYFDSLKTAILWCMKYNTPQSSLSPRKAKNYVDIYYQIRKSLYSNKHFLKGMWRLKI